MNEHPKISHHVAVYLDGIPAKDCIEVVTFGPVSPTDGYDGPGYVVRAKDSGSDKPYEVEKVYGRITIKMGPGVPGRP